MKIAGFMAAFLAAAVSLWSNINCSSRLLPQKLIINIDVFYTNEFATSFNNDNATESKIDKKVIDIAQGFLKNFQLTAIELNVLGKTKIGSQGTKTKTEMRTFLEEKSATDGDAKADIFVHFVNTNDDAQMFPSSYKGKMCHKERSFRTLTMNWDGNGGYAFAKHLVYFIGQLLGMRADNGLTAKDGTSCANGPMYFEKYPSKKQLAWNQCNAEDLTDFYNEFVRPQKEEGRVPKKFCLGPQPLPNALTISVHAFHEDKFETEFKKGEVEKVVKKAEDILNKNGNFLGPMFFLKVIKKTLISAAVSLGKAMMVARLQGSNAADIFVFFVNEKRYLQYRLNTNICTGKRALRTFKVSRSTNGFTRLGAARQLVYFIGRSLGMNDDFFNDLSDASCPDGGYMHHKAVLNNPLMPTFKPKPQKDWDDLYKYWNKVANWNQCNVEALKAAYATATTNRVDGPGPQWQTSKRHCLDW